MEFAFVVPECEPGTILKVPAPDGVSLHIPCPGNIRPGDKLFMAKSGEGKWAISKAERAKTGWRSEAELLADLRGSDVVTVELQTSKGPVRLQVVPSWAPLGARRFLELVQDRYFQDIAIYRGIAGGLVQFGLVQERDPRCGRYAPIEDDPLVGIPFEDGTVTFAAAGPGTRKSTVCIFLGDFRSQLGMKQPETPFGRVCPESMETLHRLFTGYGDMPQCGGRGPDPERLEELGNSYIRSEFPECDFVNSARRLS